MLLLVNLRTGALQRYKPCLGIISHGVVEKDHTVHAILTGYNLRFAKMTSLMNNTLMRRMQKLVS